MGSWLSDLRSSFLLVVLFWLLKLLLEVTFFVYYTGSWFLDWDCDFILSVLVTDSDLLVTPTIFTFSLFYASLSFKVVFTYFLYSILLRNKDLGLLAAAADPLEATVGFI
jgi:hypothetical protein